MVPGDALLHDRLGDPERLLRFGREAIGKLNFDSDRRYGFSAP